MGKCWSNIIASKETSKHRKSQHTQDTKINATSTLSQSPNTLAKSTTKQMSSKQRLQKQFSFPYGSGTAFYDEAQSISARKQKNKFWTKPNIFEIVFGQFQANENGLLRKNFIKQLCQRIFELENKETQLNKVPDSINIEQFTSQVCNTLNGCNPFQPLVAQEMGDYICLDDFKTAISQSHQFHFLHLIILAQRVSLDDIEILHLSTKPIKHWFSKEVQDIEKIYEELAFFYVVDGDEQSFQSSSDIKLKTDMFLKHVFTDKTITKTQILSNLIRLCWGFDKNTDSRYDDPDLKVRSLEDLEHCFSKKTFDSNDKSFYMSCLLNSYFYSIAKTGTCKTEVEKGQRYYQTKTSLTNSNRGFAAKSLRRLKSKQKAKSSIQLNTNTPQTLSKNVTKKFDQIEPETEPETEPELLQTSKIEFRNNSPSQNRYGIGSVASRIASGIDLANVQTFYSQPLHSDFMPLQIHSNIKHNLPQNSRLSSSYHPQNYNNFHLKQHDFHENLETKSSNSRADYQPNPNYDSKFQPPSILQSTIHKSYRQEQFNHENEKPSVASNYPKVYRRNASLSLGSLSVSLRSSDTCSSFSRGRIAHRTTSITGQLHAYPTLVPYSYQ